MLVTQKFIQPPALMRVFGCSAFLSQASSLSATGRIALNVVGSGARTPRASPSFATVFGSASVRRFASEAPKRADVLSGIALSDPSRPRAPRESYVRKALEFRKSEKLKSVFANPFGGVRVGMVLEELDALAGSIGYAHVLTRPLDESLLVKPESGAPFQAFELPVIVVTASVNRIELYNLMELDSDLIMEGCVAYAGRSSMEVNINVTSISDAGQKPVMNAVFTMVARDTSNRAHTVPKVLPQTVDEQRLYQMLSDDVRNRKFQRESALSEKPPTSEERELIHHTYQDSKRVAPGPESPLSYIGDTRLESTVLMQPQYRNIHNKIFGGFFMKRAYELAWSSAYLFTGKKARFRAVDDVSFLAAGNIGDVSQFTSEIVYTDDKGIQVSVAADVLTPAPEEPNGVRRTRTTTFHFTFVRPEGFTRRVVPFSYEDAMKFVHGRRLMLKLPAELMRW
eukprot:TRINITY_DN11644_c0_g1_i1.p1 TRINITY_DN11644_c0_g1~~TRINITY_DN11644_c0_g1_i1.p1  ORF type:complete len:454 (-),score=128.72 TRINITY_DN11644_c0_g1_i1:179-1540(-)